MAGYPYQVGALHLNAPRPTYSFGSDHVWSLWDMLRIYSDAFVTVTNQIAHISGMIEMQTRDDHRRPLSKDTYDSLAPWVSKLAEMLDRLEVPATRAAARYALKLLEDPKSPGAKVGGALDDIMQRFQAELEGKDFICLTAEETRLFNEAREGFGDAVDDAFPEAIEDIYEAAACAAMHRFTASVFHLMRAMECAVQRLSITLKIEDPDRVWGKLLSDIESKIKGMPNGSTRDAWSEAHAHLYHVKQAWRNKTMHPKKTYTEEEAHGVYTAVRSFMRHLAPLVG